jgi:putative transposase
LWDRHAGQQTNREWFPITLKDRDTKFTAAFDAVFTADGIDIIASPTKAPRANAICERLIGTLRREMLDKLLVLNPTHLRKVLEEYRSHYNRHRPHQARAQCPPDVRAIPPPLSTHTECSVRRTPILGGLINEYQHAG